MFRKSNPKVLNLPAPAVTTGQGTPAASRRGLRTKPGIALKNIDQTMPYACVYTWIARLRTAIMGGHPNERPHAAKRRLRFQQNQSLEGPRRGPQAAGNDHGE